MTALVAAVTVVFFWVILTGTTITQKAVLLEEEALSHSSKESVVLVTTWIQCIGCWLGLALVDAARALVKWVGARIGPEKSPLWRLGGNAWEAAGGGDEPREGRGGRLTGVLEMGIVSLLFGVALLLDNLCLQAVNVTFLLVARTLTLPFAVAAGSALGARAPALGTLLRCCLCCAAFASGTLAQPAGTRIGAAYGAGSSLCFALAAVLVARQRRRHERRGAWRLMAALNGGAALWLAAPVLARDCRAAAPGGCAAALAAAAAATRGAAAAQAAGAAAALLTGCAALLHARHVPRDAAAASACLRAAAQRYVAFAVYRNAPSLHGEAAALVALVAQFWHARARGAPLPHTCHAVVPAQAVALVAAAPRRGGGGGSGGGGGGGGRESSPSPRSSEIALSPRAASAAASPHSTRNLKSSPLPASAAAPDSGGGRAAAPAAAVAADAAMLELGVPLLSETEWALSPRKRRWQAPVSQS